MFGQICKIFPGESWGSCWNSTKEQVLGRYYESRRQEARKDLRSINVLMAVKSTKAYEEIVQGPDGLEQRANPVDPEADGHFGREDIQRLRMVLDQEAAILSKKTGQKESFYQDE